MRRLAWAALLGVVLVVAVVLASALAGAGTACAATAGCPHPSVNPVEHCDRADGRTPPQPWMLVVHDGVEYICGDL